MVGIYKFTNRITGEVYIGKSTNVQRRYNSHKTKSNPNNKWYNDSLFHQAISQYGFENFDFEVVEECEKEELNDKEVYYISHYNSVYPKGYNISVGGTSPNPQKLTYSDVEEIKEKLRNNQSPEKQIAQEYGVTLGTISSINVGRSWRNPNERYPIRSHEEISTYKKYRYCVNCGAKRPDNSKQGMCIDCWKKARRKFMPSEFDLSELLKNNSQEAVGRMFGVTGKAVSKWREKYGLNINGNLEV